MRFDFVRIPTSSTSTTTSKTICKNLDALRYRSELLFRGHSVERSGSAVWLFFVRFVGVEGPYSCLLIWRRSCYDNSMRKAQGTHEQTAHRRRTQSRFQERLETLGVSDDQLDVSLREAGFIDPEFNDEPFRLLAAHLLSMKHVAVAYSGGVDSTFLLRVAWGLLGDRCLGVLAFSESLDRNELTDAKRVVEAIGAPYKIIETHEYDNPAYRVNNPDRCYHCKNELFDKAKAFAAARGIAYVLDGSNADDVGDYRPGLRARDEHGVSSPLLEAGLDKAAIRHYSKILGLPTWDKPAAPCLSSRIPYGSEVTSEKLRQVERVENDLRQLGFRVVRVRHHGDVARVEIPAEDLPRFVSEANRQRVVAAAKSAGFIYVAVDLEGFRSGSLNRTLTSESDGAAPAGRLIPVDALQKLDSGGPSS